ncbi:MAG TPA: PDZ domain-containing protein [bacterium]
MTTSQANSINKYLLVTAALFICVCLPLAAEVLSDSVQQSIMTAIEQVRPALVRIHVISVEDESGREVKREAVGSGVIVTTEGHVITNHHVAGRGTRFVCTLSDKTEIDAELVGSDPLSDISVIKLKDQKRSVFASARFGDSDKLAVGDPVLAMGSPLAFSQSVTMGIVSNTELIIPEFLKPYASITLEGEDVGSIVRWIGHDAAIFPGNSGGPLVNMQGAVIGINEINLGISGAIPGNLAKKIADELIRTGKITRSWFGLEVQPLFKYGGRQEGVLVSGTIKGSPAAQAGFMPGDILTAVDGQKVNVQFAEELPLFNQLMMDCPVGKPVNCAVLRKNKTITLTAVPREREYFDPRSVELKQWGIMARDISTLAATEMKRADKKGVLVTSVRPGGPCGEAKPTITYGDIILAVNQRPVNDIKDFKAVTDDIVQKKEEPVTVVVLFERGTEQCLAAVKIGVSSSPEQGQELQKPWLAVASQVFTKELARALDLAPYQGVRITQVYSNHAADKAGLVTGDIIIAIDGKTVEASEPSDVEVLATMLRRYDIGAVVKLTVLHGGDERTITCRLEPTPRLPREMKKYRDDNFELTVRDIAFEDRIAQKLDEDQPGVLIDDISSGSWAALSSLMTGDLITGIDQQPVADVGDFEKTMNTIARAQPKSVAFNVIRGIHRLFVELEPSWEEK